MQTKEVSAFTEYTRWRNRMCEYIRDMYRYRMSILEIERYRVYEYYRDGNIGCVSMS